MTPSTNKKKFSIKAAQVTEEFVLEKFVDLLNDEEASWSTKIKGLELLGKYLSMFQDQKKVDVNYTLKSLFMNASMGDLEKIIGGADAELVSDNGEYHIDSGNVDPGRLLQTASDRQHDGDSIIEVECSDKG